MWFPIRRGRWYSPGTPLPARLRPLPAHSVEGPCRTCYRRRRWRPSRATVLLSFWLFLVRLMPTFPLATVVLGARSIIGKRAVPPGRSPTGAGVGPEDRPAPGVIRGVPRPPGAAVALVFAGFLSGRPSLMRV